MLKPEIARDLFRSIARYTTVYASWIVTCALGFLDLVVARESILDLYVALGFNKWGYGAVANWSMVLFGLVWLIAIIFSEAYYREGVEKSLLPRRFLKVTLIQVGILLVGAIIIQASTIL